MGGGAKGFSTALGRIDIGVCYTRGARSRRWCGWWGRRGRWGRGWVGIAASACVVVLRVGDAGVVGIGKRAPHGFRCPCLVSPHGSLDRLKAYLYIISSTLNSKRQTKQALGTR